VSDLPDSGSPAPVVRGGAGQLAVLGGLHAFLFLGSYFLLTSGPSVRAPDQELIDFYQSSSRRRLVLVGVYVMPFAGITFLWFSMMLRGWLRAGRARAKELAWGLYLASSILYVAMFFCGAAASSVTALASEHSPAPVDPLVLRVFPQLGANLLMVFGMRMAAMFVFSTSLLGRLAEVLPRWYAHVGLVAGTFLLLSPSTRRELVLVFPLWMLGLSGHLWLARRALPQSSVQPS
jgi:hypothetical protein